VNQLRNKSLETLAIRMASMAFSVAAGIILARSLGTYGKGVMAYITTVAALLQTAWSGQAAAISWQFGRLKTPSRLVVQATLRILFFGGLPIALMMLAAAFAIPNQRSLIAVAVSIPFLFFSSAALGFFLADGNVRVGNVQALITQVGFGIAVGVVLLVVHLGLSAVLVAWIAASVVSAAYTGWKLRPYFAQGGEGSLGALIREQVVFGIRASANAVVWLLNTRIDVFIIMSFLGLRALGIYSVGLGLGELMTNLSSALVTSAYGRISSGSLAEAAELAAKCARHCLAMGLCIGAVIFLVGPSLVTLVYGPAFANAGPVIRILLPGMIAYSLMPFLYTFFTQQLGKPGIPTVIGSLSIAVCAAVTILTIRPLGIVAGALGTSISYGIAFLVAGLVFSRITSLPMSRLFLFTSEDWREYRTLYGTIKRWALSRQP
jgi:O-antigen/teichoic acid export membrane protein